MVDLSGTTCIFKENRQALPPLHHPSLEVISSLVRGGANEPLPTPCRSVDLVWSSVGSCSCCELMSSLVLMARRRCVAPALPTSDSYKLSTPFSAVVPSSGEGVGQRSPVCDWELYGHSFSAGGSVGGSWVSSHPSCTEQFLWRGMRAALTYRETETTLKINLALCPLSKIIVVGPSLRSASSQYDV